MEPVPGLVGEPLIDFGSVRADEDLDSARGASGPTRKAVLPPAPAPAHNSLDIQKLAAENKRLKRALEARELHKKTKILAKQKQILKELQVKHALATAIAEHKELKQVAQAELKVRRDIKEQQRLRDEYDKIRFKLKCMDIELHTEGPDWTSGCSMWGPMQSYTQVSYKVVDNRTHKTTEDTLQLKVFNKPFASGGCRLAYYAQDDKGARYVAKTSMRQGTRLANNIAEMEEDVNAHMMAAEYAKAFNAALAIAELSAQKIVFHDVHLLLLQDMTVPVGPQSALFLEPFLDGRFEKWHGNDGRTGRLVELLQAFSHFTHKHMQGLSPSEKGVVVDIQGVVRGNRFVLTDPAIHCTCDSRRYGDTNLGQEGIDSFFSGHTCNTTCHALDLPVPV